MGKGQKKEETKKPRGTITRRIGKHIPSAKISKRMKGKFERMQKNSAVFLAVAVESAIQRLLVLSSDAAGQAGGKSIKAEHFYSTVNAEDAPFGRMFPKHIAGVN